MMKLQKLYRYEVTKVGGPRAHKKTVEVGDVLLYKIGKGPTHCVEIRSIKTGRITQWWLLKSIGVCWVRGKKIVKTVHRKHRLSGVQS